MRVREGPLALAHEALFRVAFGDVHRDPATRARDEREERIGDGVRRVRRDADLLKLGLERIVARELFREPRSGLAHRRGIRGWREHLLVHDPAHAALAHGFEHDAGIARVRERRDPRAHALHDAPPRGIEKSFGRHHGDLRALQSRDPLAE